MKEEPLLGQARGRGWSSSRVPFHCSWLGILRPRSTQECSRLGFLRDIIFYCTRDTISVSPCLAAMWCGNKCLHSPLGGGREEKEEEEGKLLKQNSGSPNSTERRGKEQHKTSHLSITNTGKWKTHFHVTWQQLLS